MSPAHTVTEERACGKAFLAGSNTKILIKLTTSGCTQHRGDVRGDLLSLAAPASTNGSVSSDLLLQYPSHVS